MLFTKILDTSSELLDIRDTEIQEIKVEKMLLIVKLYWIIPMDNSLYWQDKMILIEQ